VGVRRCGSPAGPPLLIAPPAQAATADDLSEGDAAAVAAALAEAHGAGAASLALRDTLVAAVLAELPAEAGPDDASAAAIFHLDRAARLLETLRRGDEAVGRAGAPAARGGAGPASRRPSHLPFRPSPPSSTRGAGGHVRARAGGHGGYDGRGPPRHAHILG
jgi:hypothetical protein